MIMSIRTTSSQGYGSDRRPFKPCRRQSQNQVRVHQKKEDATDFADSALRAPQRKASIETPELYESMTRTTNHRSEKNRNERCHSRTSLLNVPQRQASIDEMKEEWWENDCPLRDGPLTAPPRRESISTESLSRRHSSISTLEWNHSSSLTSSFIWSKASLSNLGTIDEGKNSSAPSSPKHNEDEEDMDLRVLTRAKGSFRPSIGGITIPEIVTIIQE